MEQLIFKGGVICLGTAFNTNGEITNSPLLVTTIRRMFENAYGETEGESPYVSDIKNLNLREDSALIGGIRFNGETFASNTSHTLKMFYLERGNYDSSLSVKFNLQPALYQQIKKVDQDGNPLEGAKFDVYELQTPAGINKESAKNVTLDQVRGQITDASKPITWALTDEKGEAIFLSNPDDRNSDPYNFSDRYNAETNAGLLYLLRESEVPGGYKSVPQDILLRFDPDNTMFVVNNRYQTGAYSSFNSYVTSAPNDVVYGALEESGVVIGPSEEDLASQRVPIDIQEDGLVVAIPLLREGSNQWNPLYGDNLNGFETTGSSTSESILKAALLQASQATQDTRTSGWYLGWDETERRIKGTLENLPGRADRYVLINDNGDMRMLYAIIQPVGLADALGISREELSGLSSAERYELLGEMVKEQGAEAMQAALAHHFQFLDTSLFDRNFRSVIYIPNEVRQLRVMKVDQNGNPVNGAEFTLYNDEACKDPAASGRTATIVGENGEPIDGMLIFEPWQAHKDAEDSDDPNGYASVRWPNRTIDDADADMYMYYLKETDPPAVPEGESGEYELNPNVIPVKVGVYSIYADAGKADDGVVVMAGVGKLVQTMVKYTDDQVNVTLRDIKALQQYQESGSFSAAQEAWKPVCLKDSVGQDTGIQRFMDLRYGENAVIDYGLVQSGGDGLVWPFFVADTGYVRATVRQNAAALAGSTVNYDNLGDTDITGLFSLVNIVVVTDKKTEAAPTGSLMVSKKVVGEGLSLPADYIKDYRFKFEFTDKDGNAIPADKKFYYFGRDMSGYIANGGELLLHHDESVTILGLPEGTKYKVTEIEANDGGFYTQPLVGYIEGVIVADDNSTELPNDSSTTNSTSNPDVPDNGEPTEPSNDGGTTTDGTGDGVVSDQTDPTVQSRATADEIAGRSANKAEFVNAKGVPFVTIEKLQKVGTLSARDQGTDQQDTGSTVADDENASGDAGSNDGENTTPLAGSDENAGETGNPTVDDEGFTKELLTVISNDIVTYKLVIENKSDTVAKDVTVTDFVPKGLTYIDGTAKIRGLGEEEGMEKVVVSTVESGPNAGRTKIEWKLGDLEAIQWDTSHPGDLSQATVDQRIVEFQVRVPSITEYRHWINDGSLKYTNNPDGADKEVPSNEVEIEGNVVAGFAFSKRVDAAAGAGRNEELATKTKFPFSVRVWTMDKDDSTKEVPVSGDFLYTMTKSTIVTDETGATSAQVGSTEPALIAFNEKGEFDYLLDANQDKVKELSLADGETITIYGLPLDAHYEIAENLGEGWRVVKPSNGVGSGLVESFKVANDGSVIEPPADGSADAVALGDSPLPIEGAGEETGLVTPGDPIARVAVQAFTPVEFVNEMPPSLEIHKGQRISDKPLQGTESTLLGLGDFSQELQQVTSGDVVEYRLVVTNTSQVPINNVTVTDVLPPQQPLLTYVDGSSTIMDVVGVDEPAVGSDPIEPKPGDGTLIWEIGPLGPGASKAITFKMTVPVVEGVHTWVNYGTAKYDEGPKDPEESEKVKIQSGVAGFAIAKKIDVVANGDDSAPAVTSFPLTVELWRGADESKAPVSGSFHYIRFDAAGKGGEPAAVEFDENGVNGTLSIAPSETLAIYGLPEETQYKVTEVLGESTGSWEQIAPDGGAITGTAQLVQVPEASEDAPAPDIREVVKEFEVHEFTNALPALAIEKWQKVEPSSEFTQETQTVTSADVVTYRLVVSNPSQVVARGVKVVDYVPNQNPRLTYVADSAAIEDADKLELPENPIELIKDGADPDNPEAGTVTGITWNLGDLEPGGSRAVTFKVKVPSVTEACQWVNQGSTTYENNPDGPKVPIESNEVVIKGKPGTPELEIHKRQAVAADGADNTALAYTQEVLPDLKPGTQVAYMLEVKNASATDALGVKVTDKVPLASKGEGQPPLSYVDGSASDGGQYDEASKTITWDLGTLPAGESRTLYFRVQVPQVTQDTEWANVATLTAKGVPDKPSEEVKVESPVPQLLIEKLHRVGAESEFTKDLLHVERDSVVTYQLVVTHDPADSKPADAKGLHVTDVVPTAPSGAPYGYVSDSLWGAVVDGAGATVEGRAVSVAYDGESRTVSCDADLLLPGEKLIISFDVCVPAVREYTRWTNVGYLSYDNNPEGPGEEQPSNPVEEETDVPNVVIKKLQSTPDQHDGKPVDVLLHVPAGAEVTYHVTVTNDPKRPESTQAATGVVVTDHVPDGLELVEVLDDGAYDAETGNITWNVGDLAARESKTVRFTVKVPQVPAYTKWVNTASTHYDNNPDNPDDPEEPKPEKPSNEVEVDTDVTGLLVSKTAVVPEGVADDGSAAFAFDVTVVAPDGKPVAGSYFMARATEKNEAGTWVFGEPEPVQFADGRPVLADNAPLTLRNLEAVRFIGLPEKSTYQVVETPADGWTQTKAENAEGSLTTGETVEAAFTNTKDYGPAHLAIDGSKVMTGRPFAAGAFTFVLAPGNDQTQKAVEEGAVVLPESLETTNGDPVQFEDGSAAWSAPWAFGEIVFNRAGDYEFKVTERVPAGAEKGRPVNGVRYDTVTRVVGVNVSPGTEGSLVATKKLVNATEADAPIVFTNAYAGDRVMVPITGVKVLEGRELQAGEFTFQLVSGEGENERVIAVTNNGQGIFAFPANALTYTVADLADVAPAADGTRTKEFFYVVRELVPDDKYALPGVTYDLARYLVKVTLTDNGQGVLSAVPTVTLEGAEGAVDSIVFSNVYAHQGTAETVLQVGKVLTGRPINSNEFSFTAVDLATGRVAATGIAPATADGTPVSVSLEKITYDAASMADAEQYEDGTRGKAFTYEIAENVGNLPLVTYDRTRYYARVWVVDDGLGQMTASAPAYFWDMACEQPVEGNWPVFRNAYDAPKASYTPEAYKSTWGPEGADLTGLSFGFEVTDNNGGDAQGSVVARGMANANGPVVFDKALEFSAAGTYHYVLTERNNGAPSVTYDTAAYLLDVTVGFNEAGGLAVTEAVYRNVERHRARRRVGQPSGTCVPELL